MAEPMLMDAVSDTKALADLGLNAVDLFGKVEKALKERADEAWPEDMFVAESERFELWAANMGLFVAGHGSLDYRVREAERLVQTLRRFIQDLINSLEDVLQMCSDANQEGAFGIDGDKGDRLSTQAQGDEDEDDEDEEVLDMDLLVDSVRDPINRLFKVSTKIRNPSTRLGSSRAANYRQVDEETGVDFLQAIKGADLDYVRSVFLEYRKAKARREGHPAEATGGPSEENDDEVWEPIRTVLSQEREQERTGANSYLIERIAQANVRRRQQFAYWARHREKLDKHTKAFQAQKGRLPIPNRDKFDRPLPEFTPGPVPSVTTATMLDMARLEISDNRSNWTISEYAPSTRQAADAPVDFPPAPKTPRKTQTDKFFECPYCFFLCPKEILAEKAWKAHLIHDLRPYICTYEDCRNPTQLYDSRKDWTQHENSEHRKVWRCLQHPNQVFESLETYKRHLQEQHPGSISGEASFSRIIQASESVSDTVERICPVCLVELKTSRAMESHIALHLERFARFSLPRSIISDDDGSNADSGKANRVDEEGSRDDDFEGGFELHSDMEVSETGITGDPPEAGSSASPQKSGTPGDVLQDSQAFHDGDGLSSESGSDHNEVQRPSDDSPNNEASSDEFKVGEWWTDPEKYEEAEQRYRDALEQSEKTMGPEHPATLDKMAALGDLVRGQMKYLEAEQIYRKVVELRAKILGRENLDTLDAMDDLSVVLHKQTKYTESAQIDQEVLELKEKALGRRDPVTLLSISNLGMALMYLGRVEEGEKLCREAMEGRREVLGPTHIDTLQGMSNLAVTLDHAGRWEEAGKLYMEVIEIYEQEFGPDHPDTLNTKAWLAEALWKQDRFEEAEKLEVEVMETRKKKLGPLHPATLLGMSDLAVTLKDLGRIEEAKMLHVQVIESRKQKLGSRHPETLISMANLGALFWDQGLYEEAEKLEVEVLETRKQTLGLAHPTTLRSMSDLAHTLHAQGRIAEAVALMDSCVQLSCQLLGLEHRDAVSRVGRLEDWRAEQVSQ